MMQDESNLSPVGFQYGLAICDCPFCGSVYVEVLGHQRMTGQEGEFVTLTNVVAVHCLHCLATGPTVKNENLRRACRWAIRRWNCYTKSNS